MAAGIVLLAAIVLFGCSLLGREAAGPDGWYIRLNIGSPGAKGINVGEYEVIAVEVALFEPGEEFPFFGVSCDVDDFPFSELIPVSGPGTYEIRVTHIGEDNGEPVEVTESAAFQIEAMLITVIEIVPGCVGTIEMPGGGEPPQMEDGRIFVHLNGMLVPDDTTVPIGVFPAGIDPSQDPMGTMAAMGGSEIIGGEMFSTMTEPDTPIVWFGTGGEYYDVYIWIDMNNNLDEVMFPEPDEDLQAIVFPVTVQIDGDVTLEFDYDDFEVVEEWL